jgi:hypothetical protein
MGKVFSTKTQLVLAWFFLVASVIGWPISLITTDEPPYILSLSWLALTLTAFNWISAAEANRRVEVQAEKAEVEHADKVEVNT